MRPFLGIALALCFVAAPSARAADAPAAPDMTQLDRLVWIGVAGELTGGNGLNNSWGQIATLAIAESLNHRSLEAYRYVGETARTDKQIGSNPNARGTTSLLEKPGIAEILGFAIEHGAIQEEQSGTDLTLRSSPAVLYRILYRNKGLHRVEDEAAYRWLSRVGVSATLPSENSDSVDGETLDLETVTAWSVQLNLNFWGDRTVHSTAFVKQWNEKVGPAIDKRLMAMSELMRVTLNDSPQLMAQVLSAKARANERVRALIANSDLSEYRRLSELPEMDGSEMIVRLRDDPFAQSLVQEVQTVLATDLIEPVRKGTLPISQTTRTKIEADFPDVVESHVALAAVKKDLDTALADVTKVPMFSVEYTNHKALEDSNYSEAKLLFQYRADLTSLVLFPEPFDIILNANASFFHDPDKSKDEETVRDYGVSLAAEFSFDNVLNGLLKGDHAPITAQISGKVSRLESEDDEAGFLQGKVEIPIVGGVSLPLSVTYATRTEDNKEDEVRGNLGFTIDTDKLMALAKLAFMN